MRSLCVVVLLAGCTAAETDSTDQPIENHHEPAPVGLGLHFTNGAIDPIALAGDAPRFLQEIDLIESVVTATDQGAAPALHLLPGVDWHGLRFIEEDWREAGDGTWTRMRFYRGARWMEHASTFTLHALDHHGHEVGQPIRYDAGSDDHWDHADDGLVRRFNVRQLVKGCAAKNDCSNVTAFEVQALVQARQNLHPEQSERIPASAETLRLGWSAQPGTAHTVAVTHAAPSTIGYGFAPTLAVTNTPAAGYFQPGQTIDVRVAFFDGAGHRLHPADSLPTYLQSITGAANGLRYWDPSLDATLYYAFKHREANMVLQFSGPADKLRVPTSITTLEEFLAPQVTIASTAPDGFTAAGVEIPQLPTVLAGLTDPAAWSTPVPAIQTVMIPADAQPGTYTLSIKARRDWGGEPLNRGATIDVQVGPHATAFTAKTGNCQTCHADRAALAIVNHGLGDRRSCFGCHPALSFEPDNALDTRIHSIHSRSTRFPGTFAHCATCHLAPPSGPARGAFTGDPN